jgi:glycolate oxidase FAD binding subunit
VLWPERATIGGILSVNDSGALRLRYGGLRDLVIGVTLARSDGLLAASGGKVVKNVAGYDLPKLVTGAFGTLGVITQATFRLHPLPRSVRTLMVGVDGVAAAQTLMLALQDSQLAHAALQARLTQGKTEVDILLEGTPAGIDSQEATTRTIAGPATVVPGPTAAWGAREDLWPDAEHPVTGVAMAKLSMLPSDIGSIISVINRLAEAREVGWRVVVQATGLATLRLDGPSAAISSVLEESRRRLEQLGGSLVILRQPPNGTALDAWGSPGDALPVMRALKQQLDPGSVLNPGRFVGGI